MGQGGKSTADDGGDVVIRGGETTVTGKNTGNVKIYPGLRGDAGSSSGGFFVYDTESTPSTLVALDELLFQVANTQVIDMEAATTVDITGTTGITMDGATVSIKALDTASATGGDSTMAAGKTTSSGAAGGDATLSGGASEHATSGVGGDVKVEGGTSNTLTGGAVSILSGSGTATSSGDIKVSKKDAGTAGISGSLIFSSGSASDGNSGSFAISTGNADAGGKGGAITVTVGDAAAGIGGGIALTSGKSTNDAGGAITITAGISTAAAGDALSLTAGSSSGGTGGAASLLGGDSSSGDGGAITLKGGTHGTGGTGGDVIIRAGGATTRGKVQVYKQLAAAASITCTGSVASYSRTCSVTSSALAIDLTFPGGTYSLAPDACQTITVTNTYLGAADIVMCFVGKRAGSMNTQGFPAVAVDTLSTGSYTISLCNADSSYSITENVDIYCVVYKTETTRL